MKISIQIIVDYENGAPAMTKSITEFKRKDLSVDTLGLTLEESKLLLKDIQFEFVQQQVSQYIYLITHYLRLRLSDIVNH